MASVALFGGVRRVGIVAIQMRLRLRGLREIEMAGEGYPIEAGLIRAGRLADLLVIDGDPVADISLLRRPLETIDMVMIGGKALKDRLARTVAAKGKAAAMAVG